VSTLKRDLFFAYRDARNQSTSLLHSGRESGIRYEGEAEGILKAIRILDQYRMREWEEKRAAEWSQSGGTT
jgi:hypothetical protein